LNSREGKKGLHKRDGSGKLFFEKKRKSEARVEEEPVGGSRQEAFLKILQGGEGGNANSVMGGKTPVRGKGK